MVLKKNKKKNFFNSLIGLMIKNGNKQKCQEILYKAIKNTSTIAGINAISVLRTIFKRLCVFVEIKTIKQKKRIRVIPKYLNYNRRLFLTSKLLLNSVVGDKKRRPFHQKLTEEFLLLINSPKKAKSFLKKKEYEKTATKHKANCNYRW